MYVYHTKPEEFTYVPYKACTIYSLYEELLECLTDALYKACMYVHHTKSKLSSLLSLHSIIKAYTWVNRIKNY